MFLGHYAAALAGKKIAPKVSLGTLILAAQLLDLVWPIFLIFGFEQVRINPGDTKMTPLDFYNYPFTHSLLAVLGWSAFLGLAYYFFKKEKQGSVVVGLAVLSHWLLDLAVHRPDLPLIINGGPKFGLGLWNFLPITLILELGLFVLGVYIYLKTTVAKDKIGTYAFWALIVFLAGIYGLNLSGPPPPTVSALAYTALAAWIFVPWGYWIDRHRTPK